MKNTPKNIAIEKLFPFEGHPFSVKDDKDMQELVESVKRFGILEPVVVIPCKEYGYEMVSGHRRLRACQLAGITKIPVIVRNLDRDEAIISMVDANLKRENITPMEKARAYEMKLAAMKRKAGRRSKAEVLSGEKPMRADEQLAQQTGESRANIQKITRLTKLEPELQQMVEEKKLPVFARTAEWLALYFDGEKPAFIPPLTLKGTPFQKEVWEILLEIPFGQTTTYAEIAAEIARRRGLASMSAQAVGSAVAHNPISLIIPCHRVVGSDGSLTGYAGGIEKKEWLLAMERQAPESVI